MVTVKHSIQALTQSEFYKTVHREVAAYATPGLNAIAHLTRSLDGDVMSVLDFYVFSKVYSSGATLLVRIIGDQVVIDLDLNDKILKDALLQAGIPPEQIVLAYIGEQYTAATSQAEMEEVGITSDTLSNGDLRDVELKNSVRQVMQGYAATSPDYGCFFLQSDDSTTMNITVIPTKSVPVYNDVKDGRMKVPMIVRILGGKVIIERDVSDKPLLDALLQAGIPRDRIVLPFMGEALPPEARVGIPQYVPPQNNPPGSPDEAAEASVTTF